MPDLVQAAITIAVVIFSIVLHEVAHGYAANYLGDPTARLSGRLTLNPLSHLDLFGSVLVPVVTWLSGGFIFGWAKPVPYNPYNLKAARFSEAFVAAAGPATNLLLALVFGLAIRLFGDILPDGVLFVAFIVTVANIALFIFNLIPVPPLDGSKILASVLPLHVAQKMLSLEKYGFLLVFLVILVAWRVISPVISATFSLITGLSF
ncbi:MAG: site-2 protease family protein [Candidatus Campbellbacteria bacterium]